MVVPHRIRLHIFSGLDKKTIMKLLLDAGEKCSALLAAKVRNVPVMDVQADEIWGFVGKKEGHKNPFKGDDMTWAMRGTSSESSATQSSCWRSAQSTARSR
jgi:hypothetical protein